MMKVIGLIRVVDPAAFEQYREQVGGTVSRYGGNIVFRGARSMMPWNDLRCADFEAYVELEFPNSTDAQRWASSPEYTALLPIRSQAMRLTLFGVE